jgi:hypothetical protein
VPPPDGESGTFDAAEDIVDARDPADANGASSVEGTRGNWQDDGTRRGSGVGDSAPTPRDIADSARQAQRAIEDNRVPRRYQDLVRRVFERYKRRSDDGSVEPPPAPIGKDADDGASP